MKTDEILLYASDKAQFELNEFEEAFHNAMRCYSMSHFTEAGHILPENILEALQKSLKVCHLAGINSRHHFKKIYVYDADVCVMHIDWRISKRGANLMAMQIPSLNQQMARWLWEMADI